MLPRNAATLDHIFSLVDKRRVGPQINNSVLSCRGCNDDRNKKQWKALPRKIRRKMSMEGITEEIKLLAFQFIRHI